MVQGPCAEVLWGRTFLLRNGIGIQGKFHHVAFH
jgi:hypothetical protein